MPRRSILSGAERNNLVALPDAKDDIIRYYTLSEADLSLIRQRRGDANRLGFAVQLCLLRHPGQGLLPHAVVPVALREFGRIERTLFILDWLQSVELRRRVNAGLNKGEARNALARAVFFNRLGEIRDRSFEQQRYRASGLNLVTAAIVLWNTVYLERATHAIRGHGQPVDDTLFQYLSPLGWEHINLTGDYLWRSNAKIGSGKFRPLRPIHSA